MSSPSLNMLWCASTRRAISRVRICICLCILFLFILIGRCIYTFTCSVVITFTCCRILTHVCYQVPVRLCLQQTIRSPGCTLKPQLWHHSQASSVLSQPKLTSTSKVLNSRIVSFHGSRLCHRDSQNISERAEGKVGFSLKSLSQAPKPALYLGSSGLIPFMSAPLLMAATQSFYPELAYAQVVYGAAIVSFLGGARWGFAIPAGSPAQPDWMNLGNSVLPSLLAWVALLCKDNVTEGAIVVMMGLGLSLHYDLALLPGYPSWFKAMRTLLTLVATFSLVATLALKQAWPEKKLGQIQN